MRDLISAITIMLLAGCTRHAATPDDSSTATVAHSAMSIFNRDVRAPNGVRVRVEVLNATKTRGLGRKAMMFLRDRGFDVVELGTADSLRDSTLVLDRSGHADWAKLVGDAMGARSEARPDTSRYLDVTVLVGASWRPPSEPLYP